jgi:hypothetical protein
VETSRSRSWPWEWKMCTEHEDKSAYRLMQTQLYYLSIWLKIGTGRYINGSLPYRISATSVKRFMRYMENPMVICRLVLLWIHKAANQNSPTALREFQVNLYNSLGRDASHTGEHGQLWPPEALFKLYRTPKH